MKTIVRAFVAVLVLTGAVATTQISSASTTTTTAKLSVGKNSAMPIPMCPPDDPNACGMGSTK
jgi:hypothetical protein